MESYKVYKCRRQALGLTKQALADKANLDVRLVEWYEEGKRIGTDSEEKIRRTIYFEFKNIPSMDHYKRRILELALELNMEDNTKHALTEIGHMMVELGKMQMAMIETDRN